MHSNEQNNCTIGSVLMKVPSALIAHLRLQAVTMTLLGKVESYINTLHHCSWNREILHSSKDQISSMRKPQGQLFFWLVRLAIEVSDNNCLGQWLELCFKLYWGATWVCLKKVPKIKHFCQLSIVIFIQNLLEPLTNWFEAFLLS